MYTPFPGDSYDTRADFPRHFSDNLLLRSRFSFYVRNFKVFYEAGNQGKKGLLDHESLVRYGERNLRIVEGCGGKVHLRGMNNIDAVEGPVIFIGNHMSLLETAILHPMIMPRKIMTYIIKTSLLDLPYFGDIMRAIEAIPVDRKDPKADYKAVMELGKERVDRGISVIVFPQSTRSAVFNPELFNTIGIKLAKHCKVPVIPFALKTDFLANGKFIKDLGPVHRKNDVYVEFGAPMTIQGNGKAEHAAIIEFVSSRVKAWGGSVADAKAAE